MTTIEILTVAEVAVELRCSKAHVYNMIAGKVDGVGALPAISMGRRKLVRRVALTQWMATHEREISTCVDGFRKVVYRRCAGFGSRDGGKTGSARRESWGGFLR